MNSGEFVVKGIDVAINVDFSADLPLLGKVKGAFSSEHTQSLRGGSSGGAGAPFVVSNDIGWKNTSAVSLIKDKNLS